MCNVPACMYLDIILRKSRDLRPYFNMLRSEDFSIYARKKICGIPSGLHLSTADHAWHLCVNVGTSWELPSIEEWCLLGCYAV
jgi:hypothetical protein